MHFTQSMVLGITLALGACGIVREQSEESPSSTDAGSLTAPEEETESIECYLGLGGEACTSRPSCRLMSASVYFTNACQATNVDACKKLFGSWRANCQCGPATACLNTLTSVTQSGTLSCRWDGNTTTGSCKAPLGAPLGSDMCRYSCRNR